MVRPADEFTRPPDRGVASAAALRPRLPPTQGRTCAAQTVCTQPDESGRMSARSHHHADSSPRGFATRRRWPRPCRRAAASPRPCWSVGRPRSSRRSTRCWPGHHKGVIDAALRAEGGRADAAGDRLHAGPGAGAGARSGLDPGDRPAARAAMTARGGRRSRSSIVTVLAKRQEPASRALAARYWLGRPAWSCVRGIGMPVLALGTGRSRGRRRRDRPGGAPGRSIGDGARTVVFGCTGMLGFGASVAAALDGAAGKVIDPLPFAVARAHAAATVGAGAAGTSHPAPEPKRNRGLRRLACPCRPDGGQAMAEVSGAIPNVAARAEPDRPVAASSQMAAGGAADRLHGAVLRDPGGSA